MHGCIIIIKNLRDVLAKINEYYHKLTSTYNKYCHKMSKAYQVQRTKNNLSCRRYVQCTVSVLHIGPNLTHWWGSRSGGMLEIWRGHSTGLMHGHSRGAHTGTNDWHSCYSRLWWWGATAPWNWILRRGAKRVSTWGRWRRAFSSPILKQLAPYLLLYNYVQDKK